MCKICGCDARSSGEHSDHEHHSHFAHPSLFEHTHSHADDATHTHDHSHGAHSHPRRERLELDLLAKSDRLAARNREQFQAANLSVLNIIGSPGAGKTALLEATLRHLAPALSLAVLEGDQETARDAERIHRAGGRVVQINTGTGCHLDPAMIARGVHELRPDRGSVVFVENVGNLVCPALFDLGEKARIVVMSVTEGEDKPLKYPQAFRSADLLVLTKLDLAEHTGFDTQLCIANARAVHPGLSVLLVSARSGQGIAEWCRWVEGRAVRRQEQEHRAQS